MLVTQLLLVNGKFQIELYMGYDLQRSHFDFLLIFAWTLQQCSANALPVMEILVLLRCWYFRKVDLIYCTCYSNVLYCSQTGRQNSLVIFIVVIIAIITSSSSSSSSSSCYYRLLYRCSQCPSTYARGSVDNAFVSTWQYLLYCCRSSPKLRSALSSFILIA